MYYGDLFHKRRKTEPKPILALRSCTMVLLLIFLVVYVVFLIKYTISDGPVLQYSIDRGDQILIPDVEIITPIPFNLTCKFVRTIDNDLSDDCRKYLIQETLPGGGSRGMFRNNNNVSFVNSTTEPNAIKSVFIGILSNAPNATVQPFPFTVNYPSNNPNNPINGELISNNFYFLITQQVAQVRFTRHVRRTISSQFEGIFGINPSYDEQPYILSNMQSIPATIPDDPPEIFSSVIVVKVRSFFTTVETEQRSRTVLGMFGLVGGAWGLAVALYAFLFGVDRIAPWGFVQYRCGFCGLSARVRDELEDALPVIPLVDGSSSHEESAALQDRIRALDLFLREYVVDVDCLERLKERNKQYR